MASWERIIQSINKHRQSLPFIGLCWALLGPGSFLGPTVTDYREAGQTQVTELRGMNMSSLGLDRRKGCSREREQ